MHFRLGNHSMKSLYASVVMKVSKTLLSTRGAWFGSHTGQIGHNAASEKLKGNPGPV